MKLLEVLKKYKGKDIKVGSGTSFWFCGTLLTEPSVLLNTVSNNYITKTKKSIARYEEDYKSSLAEIERLKPIVKSRKVIDKKEKEDAKVKLERNEAKVKKLEKLIARLNKYLNNFTPLAEREVKDIYPGICLDEPGTTIIMAKGTEKGPYWTINEYKNRGKKNVRQQIKKTIYYA